MQASISQPRSGSPGLLIVLTVILLTFMAFAASALGDLFATFDAMTGTAESIDLDIATSLAENNANVIVNQAGELVEKTATHGPKHNVAKSAGYTAVIDCLSKGGQIQEWFNPATGKKAKVCQLGPTSFGLQILFKSGTDEAGHDIWSEITAFLKEKFTKLSQVENYLSKDGYVRLVK